MNPTLNDRSKMTALAESTPVSRPSVVLVDDHEPCSQFLAPSFRKVGMEVWCAASFDEAEVAVLTARPSLMVIELKIGGQSTFDFIGRIKRQGLVPRVVVATYYPTVVSAVLATRSGADGYLAKPVDAKLILSAVGDNDNDEPGDSCDQQGLPALDRTIQDYLLQAYAAAGSMSEAARRLGLDRRSLRRMLNRAPRL
jgi:two-component system response regulator RegA